MSSHDCRDGDDPPSARAWEAGGVVQLESDGREPGMPVSAARGDGTIGSSRE